MSDSMSHNVKYPHVEVRLSGSDGNAFAILGLVVKAMRRADPPVPKREQEAFHNDAMSGDYDHLLQTCMKWVSVS